MLVRMYTVKECETLVIETAHFFRLGCFDVHGLLKKCLWTPAARGRFAERFHADGLTMRKDADIFALISRGRSSDRTPPRESLRRTHDTLQPVWMKV